MTTNNRKRMQALFDAVMQTGEVVIVTSSDGAYRQLPKDEVWNAFTAACRGEINTPTIRMLLAVTGANSRIVGLVRMLARSIQQAHSEGVDLTEPIQNRIESDDIQV